MTLTSDVNVMADIFYDLTTKLLNKHAPLKPVKKRENSMPWFNEIVHRSILERDLAKRVWKSARTNAGHNHYKSLRNKAVQCIKHAKAAYYDKKFSSKLSSRKLF